MSFNQQFVSIVAIFIIFVHISKCDTSSEIDDNIIDHSIRLSSPSWSHTNEINKGRRRLPPATTSTTYYNLSIADKQAILDLHNQARNNVSSGTFPSSQQGSGFLPPATDMEEMIWDPALAAFAAEIAEICASGHIQTWTTDDIDINSATFVEPKGWNNYIGENLASDSSEPSIDVILNGVENWIEEGRDYGYGKINNDSIFHPGEETCGTLACRNFTQIVWANTRYIGCAFHDCGYNGIDGRYRTNFVCLYFNAGNFIGSTPYDTSSTTQCTNCDGDRDNNCNPGDPLRDNLCGGGLDSSFENDAGTDIDVCDNGLGVTISDACNNSGTPTANSTTSDPTTVAPTTVNSTSQDVCNVSLNVVNNWPISKMNGWTLCLDEPYSHHIYPSCFSSCLTGDDYTLFVGAKENSTSQTFYVGAYAPSSVITTNTSSYSNAYLPSWREGYNVYWYRFPSLSFGFAPISNISLSSADLYDQNDIQRLSWHFGQPDGGYRAGDITGLNSDNVWRKVVYYKECYETSEPTTASASPTSATPTTANATTFDPTTASPTSASPSTANPSTAIPTTSQPTTSSPTIDCSGSIEKIKFENIDPDEQFGLSSNEFIEDIITVSGISGVVASIDVEIQIGKPAWTADLSIFLRYDDTEIVLISQVGGSGGGFDVIVSDSAAEPCETKYTSGVYGECIPDEPLSSLIKRNNITCDNLSGVNGDWTLTVFDHWGGDETDFGTWSIEFSVCNDTIAPCPTTDPTMEPTIEPTINPTIEPTFDPTMDPTNDPTNDPTDDATAHPALDPTSDPTADPTKEDDELINDGYYSGNMIIVIIIIISSLVIIIIGCIIFLWKYKQINETKLNVPVSTVIICDSDVK